MELPNTAKKFLDTMTPEQRVMLQRSLRRAGSHNPFVACVGGMMAAGLIPTYDVATTAPELFAALTNEHRFLLVLGAFMLEYASLIAADQGNLLDELRAQLVEWGKRKAPMPNELIATADKIAGMIDTINAWPLPATKALELFGSPAAVRKTFEELREYQRRFDQAHGIDRDQAGKDEPGVGG